MPRHVAAEPALSAATAADMDLDVRLDVLAATGRFDPPASYPSAGNPSLIVTGDFDASSAKAFAVVNQPSDSMTVYLNTQIGAILSPPC